MPGDARSLAAGLAARDDSALERLLSRRGVSPTVGWRDFFDAAEWLLDGAQVDRALVRLPRPALAALVESVRTGAPVPASDRADLLELALVDEDGLPYAAVDERAGLVAIARPDAVAPTTPDAAPPVASPIEEAAAAERAFTSMAALADILIAWLSAPPALTSSGALSAADRRRLLESGIVETGDELDDLIEGARSAGLLRPAERELLVTDAGTRWVESSTARRWELLASAFRDALPSALRTTTGGYTAPGRWADAYPLDADWPPRAALLARVALLWALVAPGGAEPAWDVALREGAPADAARLAALFPPEIDRIYLQTDLSAIAPGPLAPALDLRLRRMAVRESRAQASTYRFTAESIAAAVSEGETAESIIGFLTSLSLTGIPQPLAYLVERTAARHGLIRVGTDAASGRALVDSDDPALLDALEVDQSVRSVGLVRLGRSLTSRVSRDAVYWTLADARYPVVAVGPDGAAEPLRRQRQALSAADGPRSASHDALIAALRSAYDGDADAAWLSRELDGAVRSRSIVIVTVAMPDGATREFVLEATGLGGGRLRGRDRGSDTERTLPVSSIVSIRPPG